MLEIGTALSGDLPQLLALYQHLNSDDPLLPVDDTSQQHWQSILNNAALFYVVARNETRYGKIRRLLT